MGLQIGLQLGQLLQVVLAHTAQQEVLMVRNVSCLFYDGKVWFKTDKNFRKTRQLYENPRVALCWSGVQIDPGPFYPPPWSGAEAPWSPRFAIPSVLRYSRRRSPLCPARTHSLCENLQREFSPGHGEYTRGKIEVLSPPGYKKAGREMFLRPALPDS